MNPEIIVQDFGGRLNSDLNGTRARLLKGSSWKRQRVIIVIPADSCIPAKCALAMWNLITPPNNGIVRILAQGMEVGHAYSAAFEQILAHPDLKDWEWILTYEQDNAAPPDGLLRLIEIMEHHPALSAVSGGYFTKGVGGVFQAWGDVSDPVINFRPQVPDPNGGLVECCGIGMGFALWRISMFKDERLRKPWFVTQKGTGGVSTQDLYFWNDARKYGYRCAVDCGCKVGHYDYRDGIMW